MARIQISFLHRSSNDPPAEGTAPRSADHSSPDPSFQLPPAIPPKRSVLIGKPSQQLFRQIPKRNQLPPLQFFFSAKGGSGTSLIASTFAGMVRRMFHARVLLVDMDVPAGGIESFTGIASARSILHLQPVLNEMTETHLRSVVQQDPVTGIDILTGSGDSVSAESLSAADIRLFLREAGKHYDLLVIDGGSRITPHTIPLLQEANQAHYILTPETPSLRKLQQMLVHCQNTGVSLDKIGLILNRAGHINEIQPKDVERFQPLRLAGVVRSDYAAVQPNINLGMPIINRLRDRKPPKFLMDMMRLTQDWGRQVESFAGSVGKPL
jgi:pilus assembly protein CpaE